MTVLLIEGNGRDAQLIRQTLAQAQNGPFTLEWVDQLSKGLARLSQGGIDLVLTTLRLPDSQGLETVERIHAQAEGVPIIVLTSADEEGLALQTPQKGVQDYVVKDALQVSRHLLVHTMRSAIERRREQEELIRLASFPEQSPDPIIETDTAGVVTYLNPAARSQFPDLFASAIKHPVLWGLNGVVERLQREGRTALTREVAYGARVYEQHLSIHQPEHLVRCYFVDITERKQMEEREKEFAEAIATATITETKRAAQLDEAYQELKRTQALLIQAEKLAAVGQLASGIAHEVKNPLGIILQCVEYLEPEVKAKGGQPVEILQVIREAIKTADTIIRRLLDFSRPTPLALKPMAMSAVIDAALSLVQPQASARGIRVTKEIADGLPLVLLDQNQMKQVLINVILNAFAAMPNGGALVLRCSVKTLTEPGVGVGARGTDVVRVGEAVLVCEVEDTGTGIPRELLPQVFTPFFTTKPPGEGVGLGLAITATIIEGHRGLIRIESEPGQGTTVVFMLPIPADERQAGTR